jgi:hypothetical protein
MGEGLKNEIAILRPIPVPSQFGKRQRVCSVVGKVEPAIERERGLCGILEPHQT